MKKNILKVLVSMFVVMALLMSAACNSGTDKKEEQKEEKVESTEGADEETEKAEDSEEVDEVSTGVDADTLIVLVTMDSINQYWVGMDEAAQAEAEAQGVKYQWMAPDQKDDQQQIERVNNAVAAGADAILIAANGPDAITAALKEASDAGVKIVYVDSPANFDAVATFSTNNTQAGTTAGEEMLAELENRGVTSGKIGVVSVNAATDSTVSRDNGFRAAFEGTDFELLETQFADGDAKRAQDYAEGFITQGCVGIFGANENCAIGVGNAIKGANAKDTVVGVGFDPSDVVQELINEGNLLCAMQQNPDVMGKMGVEAAIKALKGEDVGETEVDTGVSVVKASE